MRFHLKLVVSLSLFVFWGANILATPLHPNFKQNHTLASEDNLCHGFMPENDLHLDSTEALGIDEEEYNKVLDQVEATYQDIVAGYGATLLINRLWSNNTVNASASQQGNTWNLNMYGGLARRPEVTADGFALVACHELGHHLGGVVFYDRGALPWAASEGQSDYFATIVCARNLWQNETALNATFEEKILDFDGGAEVKQKCDSVYNEIPAQHLCYRSAVAGKSLGDLLSALGRAGVPQFNTPDLRKVDKIYRRHPKGQCRLDTYVAGSLCTAQWDDSIIPGKAAQQRNSFKAFLDAKPFACHSYQDPVGHRPHCWFNPNDVAAPIINVLLDKTTDKIGQDQAKILQPIATSAGEQIIVTMDGSGDADLYVRYDATPTMEDYDCRPMIYGSAEKCELKIPKGAKEVHIKVIGWSKQSDISVEIKREQSAKLCREYSGGVGEAFDCFDDFKCKLTDINKPSDQFSWCIDY